MKSKPYPQSEEKSQTVSEPAVTYQRTAPATYHSGVTSMHDVEDDTELEKLMKTNSGESGNGLSPFTMQELHRWMDEAEAENEEDALSHEEVMREMRELILAYEN